MKVVINGAEVDVPHGARLTRALETVGRPLDRFGVAVALNGEVVPRREWSTTALTDGDRVEVLVAAQGG